MSLNTSVDAILQRMITDARNLKPTINISIGSDTYIRFATAASAIYGLYKQRDWTINQIFPTSMSRESLEQYAADRGINSENMTPAELLSYILSYIRNPASGGKPSDFERWALDVSSADDVISLDASMLTSNMPNFSADNLLKSHDMNGIGFSCTIDNDENLVRIDFGSAKTISGVGLGVTTNRNATFQIYSSEDGFYSQEIMSIDAKFWWSVKRIEPISTRYLLIKLSVMEELTEEWQTEELNAVKVYGLEVYSPSETGEKALSASCLPNYNGVGTVLMRLLPSSLSAKHCEAVRSKCYYEGPVAPREIYVSVPQSTTISVRVTIVGALVNISLFTAEVERYFAALDAGALFIPAQIIVYAIKYGATNASIELSLNDGAYYEESEALASGEMELFILGDLSII